MSNPNPRIREAALGALADVAEPEDWPRFVAMLHDFKLGIPDVAEMVLREVGPAVAPLLVQSLLANPARASFEAIELLGDFRTVEAVPALGAVLEADPQYQEVLRSLAKIGTEDAREHVRRLADSGQDFYAVEMARMLLDDWAKWQHEEPPG